MHQLRIGVVYKHKEESNLPENVPLYQEYHALIVEHAKRYYSKKPYGVEDPLKDLLKV